MFFTFRTHSKSNEHSKEVQSSCVPSLLMIKYSLLMLVLLEEITKLMLTSII